MRTIACCLLVLAACSDDPPSTMKLSLFKVTADNCDRLITGDPVDHAIKLPFQVCATSNDQTVVAGATRLELIADYGDLDFEESVAVEPPTITMLVNGAAAAKSPTAIKLPNNGTHAAFDASFVAPAEPGAQLSFVVSAATGFERSLAAISLATPDLVLAIEPCKTAPCTLRSSVGAVTVQVTVAGTTAQTVSLLSSVDGITQPDTVTIMADQPISNDHVMGLASLPVPAGTTSWQLTARSGLASQKGPLITLAAPAVTSSLSCGTGCKAGAMAELVVTAPRLIRPATAIVNLSVDGAPLVAGASLTLDEPDIDHDTISGRLAVTFPDGAAMASVVADANVAGYRAQTIQTVLQ